MLLEVFCVLYIVFVLFLFFYFGKFLFGKVVVDVFYVG